MRSVPRLPVLTMALASGAVDAFTFLSLGQVFTSNMTGNLVLLGVSASRGRFADAVGSLVAFVAFTCGLVLAFRFTRGVRGWAVRTRLTVAAEAGLLAGLLTGWALAGPQLVLIAAAALAMGMQSAVTHRLHTFIGSTTFITGALTSTIARHLTPGTGPPHGPELVAVLGALVLGAAGGTLLVVLLPLAAPALALLAVTVTLVASAYA
ncbi:YoaK family protein [Nonomuraea sp. NPDC004580]|uniref:YoaK family protein n=1 Tax=Nonomuraea sp. NPDC004580 TaxID=3154552 RepID=UPI0033A08510